MGKDPLNFHDEVPGRIDIWSKKPGKTTAVGNHTCSSVPGKVTEYRDGPVRAMQWLVVKSVYFVSGNRRNRHVASPVQISQPKYANHQLTLLRHRIAKTRWNFVVFTISNR